jgi:shikimate kinase
MTEPNIVLTGFMGTGKTAAGRLLAGALERPFVDMDAVLEERLANIHTRGVVLAPGQTIRDLYNDRTPLCERYADLVVDADGQTPEETVSAVLCALLEMKPAPRDQNK